MTPVNYPLAERFKQVQGEGVFTGTRMAFMRMVGCSVGQKVCTACDTDFDRMRRDLGGGIYSVPELVEWAKPYTRICITGGEPLDRDLRSLLFAAQYETIMCHVETSGTKHPTWLDQDNPHRAPGGHSVLHPVAEQWKPMPMWVCVSPKPGYLEDMVVRVADEVKVIIGGLGDGPGWPTAEDALRWANLGKLVYVQPRNGTKEVDRRNLDAVLALTDKHPQLRLSCQLHKFLGVR